VTSTVEAAYATVRGRIEEACRRAGRSSESVRLVAVSKTFPPATIRELLELGHGLFGENRVQEALPKMDLLGPAVRWHLVGHLQTNKVRQIIGRFELIHSVDSEKLAREIQRRAEFAGTRQPVLLQVNVAEEETKFGVIEEAVLPLVESIARMEHVDLRGLMTIPPPVEDPEAARGWFADLRELRDRCAERSGLALSELSMGMTDDFEVAIEEGATLVRVGRAIFGER